MKKVSLIIAVAVVVGFAGCNAPKQSGGGKSRR